MPKDSILQSLVLFAAHQRIASATEKTQGGLGKLMVFTNTIIATTMHNDNNNNNNNAMKLIFVLKILFYSTGTSITAVSSVLTVAVLSVSPPQLLSVLPQYGTLLLPVLSS